MTLESLRARYERTHHPGAAFKARALAKRLGVDVPDWAAVKPRRSLALDLEALRERHERGGTPDRLARLRQHARARAASAGVAVPEWAAQKIGGKIVTPVKAEAAEKRPRRRSIESMRQPVTAAVQPEPAEKAPRRAVADKLVNNRRPPNTPTLMRLTRTPARAFPPAAPVDVPAELRAWRARAVGGVVQINALSGVVVLHEIGVSPRRYATTAEAVAAVA